MVLTRLKIASLWVVLWCSLCSFPAHAVLSEGLIALDEENYVKAYEILKPFAERGNAYAQYGLATIYRVGTDEMPKNEKKTVEWMLKASEQGHAGAQFGLALSYVLGKGVPKNQKQYVHYVEKAAHSGHTEAQYFLGMVYKNGEGIKKNETAAAKWFALAAEKGHEGAQMSLGLHYVIGAGVPRDKVLGYKWLSLSAANGNEKAPKLRDDLEEDMTGAAIEKAQEMTRTFVAKEEELINQPDILVGLRKDPKKNETGLFADLPDLSQPSMNDPTINTAATSQARPEPSLGQASDSIEPANNNETADPLAPLGNLSAGPKMVLAVIGSVLTVLIGWVTWSVMSVPNPKTGTNYIRNGATIGLALAIVTTGVLTIAQN